MTIRINVITNKAKTIIMSKQPACINNNTIVVSKNIISNTKSLLISDSYPGIGFAKIEMLNRTSKTMPTMNNHMSKGFSIVINTSESVTAYNIGYVQPLINGYTDFFTRSKCLYGRVANTLRNAVIMRIQPTTKMK